MNIGVDIRSLAHGHRTGVGEYTHGLLNALFSLDTENQYYLFYSGFRDVSHVVPKWEQDNVYYVAQRWPPNKFLHASIALFDRPKLTQMIPADIDVWFSPNLHFTSLPKKTKHILTIHDLSFEHFPDCFSWKRRLWHKAVNPKKQSKEADVVLVPSEATKRDIVETYGVSKEKVRVVYPGLERNRPEATRRKAVVEKYDLPEKFVLFLGTVEPRKNIIGIVDAYKKSGVRDLGYRLVIAGARGWKSGRIMKEIEATPGVRYIGYVDAEDKSALYGLADLFAYPSLYEGFGFPVLEAMAAGTPVVTSNRSSLPEVAGGAAYLVNPYNVGEIARGMRQVLGNQELRDTYIERGKDRVKEFTWERAAKQWLTHI